jgi:DNA (cytosine-5)-methyltransferase 1
MSRPIVMLDLYCGAGGYSTGFREAMKELGLAFIEFAINHWDRAIETMRSNHPEVKALQMDIDAATPEDIDVDVIDLLHASPSCTHHSRAKGGKPRSNQLRSQPNEIWKFIDNKHVRYVTIENVPEFTKWGPLTKDGRPIKRLEGECFNAWLQQFTARGYAYEWRILNCADYGDATSRKRFFLIAVKKGCGKIRWPEPTHAENPQPDLFGHELKRWRGVNECLDYSDIGHSIFGRKNPLAHNTLRRVAVGLRKYCGIDFQIDMLGAGENDESRILPLTKPLRTQHTNNRTMIVRPFLVKLNNHATVEDVADPLTTVTTSGNHHALCTPFILKMRNNQDCASVDEPLSAIACSGAHHELCQPIIVEITNNGKARRIKQPIGTQTSKDHFAVVRSFVLGQQGGAQLRPDGEPCPTVATAGSIRKIDVAILDMSRPGGHDSGHVRSAKQPLQTLTTCDNVQGVFAVLEDGRLLDVRIRMLKPSELAAAHSFPKGYKLAGTRADQVKQIGNSIPVQTAKAIVKAIFTK